MLNGRLVWQSDSIWAYREKCQATCFRHGVCDGRVIDWVVLAIASVSGTKSDVGALLRLWRQTHYHACKQGTFPCLASRLVHMENLPFPLTFLRVLCVCWFAEPRSRNGSKVSLQGHDGL